MKILHITNGYPSIKFPTYCIFIAEQIESLNKVKYENTVFVVNPNKKGTAGYITGFVRLFFFLLNKKNYDIYHCHHILSAFLLLATNPFKKRRIVLAFLNDKQTEVKNLPVPFNIGSLIYRIVVSKVYHFIVKNNDNIQITNKTVYYLPNGVNTNFFIPMDMLDSRTALNLPLNDHLILFVSSVKIRKQKRYDRFQEVISLLKNKYNLNVAEVLMLNENREKIPQFFNACNLHLLTSDYEGSPNSVKEAMSCNMKVVSTNVGNVEKLFHNVSNCRMAETFEVEELASLCHELLTLNLPSNSRDQIFDKNLDMESVAIKLTSIYTEILKNGETPATSDHEKISF